MMKYAICPKCGNEFSCFNHQTILPGITCYDCRVKKYGEVILSTAFDAKLNIDVVLFVDANGYGIGNKYPIDTIVYNKKHMPKEKAYSEWGTLTIGGVE